MTLTDSATRLDRFTERLGEFGVSHTTVGPAGVADAVATVADTPAVGVPLPDGLGELPAGVVTDSSPTSLRAATTGVTHATLGIADYGSLVLPVTADGVEPVSLFADTHVAVLDTANVVSGMADALAELGPAFREGGASAIVATGPSATADMGALVTGAHGPKAVHAVLVDRSADTGAEAGGDDA